MAGCDRCGWVFDEDAEDFDEYNENTKTLDGWCYECAKEAFNVELGMEYLEKNLEDKEFYVDFYFNSNCLDASNSLIGLCKQSFIDSYNDKSKKPWNPEEIMKEYIFNDMVGWIDFLNDGGY